MRPTHYDALAEFLQYNCYALQELNLLGIWINGYKLCEPMKKLRQIRHLAVPFIGPHFLYWISGVVPFITWLISNWEENDCCYKLTNWQNDNFDHFEWNICHIVHLHSLYQHSISSQLEISLVLNGTTPIIQHRKWGHIKQEFAEKTKTAAKKQ